MESTTIRSRHGAAGAALDPELRRRWPDAELAASYRDLLSVYRRLLQEELKATGACDTADGFGRICGWMGSAAGGAGEAEARAGAPHEAERREVARVTRAIRAHSDWLQRLASLLAMLMHSAVDPRSRQLLVNRRRPQQPFPTYPTSPALARLVGESVLEALVDEPVPAACRSARDARRYAARAFGFRILDPSMESGQLLLGVAQAAARRVHERHSPGSACGRRLVRAVLERLVGEGLWGVDRNELAAGAVELLVSLLGEEHGVGGLAPARLIHGNALDSPLAGELTGFDAVVNNPPWGVAIDRRRRQRLRREFESVEHRPDLYLPFSELALRCLRPAGALVLILPSQALAARNTRRLRSLLAERVAFERLVVLPRASFANASVRAVALVGRHRPGRHEGTCRVTVYPLKKRMDAAGEPRSFGLPRHTIEDARGRSWWPLLGEGGVGSAAGRSLRLEEVAEVALGIQVHHVGRGDPPQTRRVVRRRELLLAAPTGTAVPVVRGREVLPFRLLEPRRFVEFDARLSWTGDHAALRRSQRIFVRELCRRDGRLSAAAATGGFVPLHGVLTVVPRNIALPALLGILNSAAAADHVRTNAASFSKVDFQKITVGELRGLPVPIAALDAEQRRRLRLPEPTGDEIALREELAGLVERAAADPGPGASAGEGALAELDAVVAAMYQAPDAGWELDPDEGESRGPVLLISFGNPF